MAQWNNTSAEDYYNRNQILYNLFYSKRTGGLSLLYIIIQYYEKLDRHKEWYRKYVDMKKSDKSFNH